jgi:predicted small metal-binding protein
MMQLACKDLTGMECDFVATGENAEDVMKKGMEHARTAHSMSDQDLNKKKRDAMAMVKNA